jgi:hypothetical protein
MPAGREMDALVATKAMGWSLITVGEHQGDHDWLDDPQNHPHVLDLTHSLVRFAAPFKDGEKWSPSDDMAAAWEVVEKMRGLGWWLTFKNDVVDWNEATFGLPGNEGITYCAVAETPELAICRAALKAMAAPMTWSV